LIRNRRESVLDKLPKHKPANPPSSFNKNKITILRSFILSSTNVAAFLLETTVATQAEYENKLVALSVSISPTKLLNPQVSFASNALYREINIQRVLSEFNEETKKFAAFHISRHVRILQPLSIITKSVKLENTIIIEVTVGNKAGTDTNGLLLNLPIYLYDIKLHLENTTWLSNNDKLEKQKQQIVFPSHFKAYQNEKLLNF